MQIYRRYCAAAVHNLHFTMLPRYVFAIILEAFTAFPCHLIQSHALRKYPKGNLVYGTIRLEGGTV